MSYKLKRLMIISLLLNVALIGLLAGQNAGKMTGHHRGQWGEKMVAFLNEAALSDDKRVELKTLWQGAYNSEWRVKKKVARQQTATILAAETFDEAAYRKQLERMIRAKGTHKQSRIDAMVAIASSLTHPDRQKMAKMLHTRKRR